MQLSANGAVIQGGVPAVQRRETEVFLERRAFQKRRSHPLFYALCCGGISLFCLFGFFGAPLFPYSAAAMAAAGRDTMMGSSLFGMTAELLRGSLPAADSAYRLLLQLCLLAAAASSAVALACAALAFAAGRTARRLTALSSTLNLLTFGTLSALVLLGAETGRAALPIDALIAFFGTLLIRILCILTHRRGRGLGNAVLLLLAAAAFTGLCLPASPLKRELMAALGAGAALSAALGEAGLSGAQALASGEEEEIARALEDMDARQAAQSLAQAAGALSGAQADAVRAAANAMLGGDVPGAAAALARASAGVPGDMDSLLRALSAALASGQSSGAQSGAGSQGGAGEGSDGNDGGQGENGSGAGSGAGESGSGSGSGAGSGQGEGESGSGAGQGSTNEQQGGAGNPGGAQGAGDGAMRYQQGTYETIYDPTRLDAAGESSQLTGEMGEGESQSVDLGFGEGEEGGDVPVGEYAGEYAQAAARAAEAENLPDSLKTYVDEYFSSLTGGDGREP